MLAVPNNPTSPVIELAAAVPATVLAAAPIAALALRLDICRMRPLMAVRNPLIFRSDSRSFILETLTRATAADCMLREGTPAASWTKAYQLLSSDRGRAPECIYAPGRVSGSLVGCCLENVAERRSDRPSEGRSKPFRNRFVPTSAATCRNPYKTAVQNRRFVRNPSCRGRLEKELPDLAALLISSTTYCVYPQQIALQVLSNRAPYLVGHGGILPCP